MKRHPAIYLVVTFIGSFGVICVERGIYFFTRDILQFADAANLWLGLVFGVAYVLGSAASHVGAARLGERRLLALVFGLQYLCHLTMAWQLKAPVVFAGTGAAAFLYGVQWPVIESYVSAGRNSQEVQRLVGWFNMSWAGAVPLALAVSGPLIAFWKPALLVLPAGLNLLTLGLLRLFPKVPEHLPDDHPSRPPAAELLHLQCLLGGHRRLLLLSYTALFMLGPLLPGILDGFGLPIETAPAFSAVIDVMRIATFAVFCLYRGWHGKQWVLWFSMVGLAGGFLAILFAGHIGMLLVGEIVFGVAMGMIYYGALHYALVISNAAVDAGGKHESLIGLGFAFGPAIGLLSIAAAPLFGSAEGGAIAILAPVFLVFSALAGRALRRRP